MYRLTLLVIVLLQFKTEAQTSVLNIADSLFVHGNYSKAIEHYKLCENQQEVYSKLAKAYIAIGNYDEALNQYEIGVRLDSNNALQKYEYAKLLSKTKNYQASSKLFEALIQLDSLNPNYYYELGLVKEQTRDSTTQYYFNKTFQLDKTHQKAIFKIAKYHLVKRAHDTVNYFVDIGLKSYANNKELISIKAQNYYWQEYYDKAIPWFEKLLDLNEASQFIYEKLSFCYASIYEYEKAIKFQELALRYDPQNATNLYILGKLYEKLQEYDKAETYIKEALAILDKPLDAEYMQLGIVLNWQKKYKEAIEVYQKALKENPNNERVHFFLVHTKDAYYEDIDTRINLYESFKEKFPKSFYLNQVNYRLNELKKEKFEKAN
ncbi:tetratricopeptide repeat protein [Aestuariivivens insulae]|uniref:tetratricopeptide repeat protein n=1 Tax=Aestuariivivens insulae TaxID=1621988 RepID=UPI001F57092C|nr:tetratricopeptide repeat protein [Aestuariivivens insulae]